MATDATGVPTSLGIPKIDPSVDAPSGLGTNAAMDSIDTLITARPAKPAGIVTGEAMVWNGSSFVRSSATNIGPTSLGSGAPDATKFLRGDGAWSVATQGPNKVTTSTMAGGPPGSPTDGDIWIATAVDANGTRWQFQYNAGSASAYKWEFIGGGVQSLFTNTADAGSAVGAWVSDSRSQITIARGGDYTLRYTGYMQLVTGSAVTVSLAVSTSTDVSPTVADAASTPTNGFYQPFAVERPLTGLAAAAILRGFWQTANGSRFDAQARTLSLTPVRIS